MIFLCNQCAPDDESLHKKNATEFIGCCENCNKVKVKVREYHSSHEEKDED